MFLFHFMGFVRTLSYFSINPTHIQYSTLTKDVKRVKMERCNNASSASVDNIDIYVFVHLLVIHKISTSATNMSLTAH